MMINWVSLSFISVNRLVLDMLPGDLDTEGSETECQPISLYKSMLKNFSYFPFLCNNISLSPANTVYVFQLVQYP